MPRLLFALTLAVALLLQATVLPEVALPPVRPNLLIVLILLWTVARGPREGALWAFGLGLALDLVALAPFGSHALALLGVVLVGVYARTPRFRLGLLLPMAAAVAATLVHDLTLLLVARATAGLVQSLLRLSLLAGLLNLICVPAVWLWVDWLHRWQARRDETVGRPTLPPARRR